MREIDLSDGYVKREKPVKNKQEHGVVLTVSIRAEIPRLIISLLPDIYEKLGAKPGDNFDVFFEAAEKPGELVIKVNIPNGVFKPVVAARGEVKTLILHLGIFHWLPSKKQKAPCEYELVTVDGVKALLIEIPPLIDPAIKYAKPNPKQRVDQSLTTARPSKPQNFTATQLGDPSPGRSALDQKMQVR